MQAYNILKEACEASGEFTFHCVSSMVVADLPRVSLPVQREYVNTRLSLCKVLLQILESHVEEQKTEHDLEKTKGHVQKVKL